jgi:hydroxymethylglutaryl-CoA lyase
MELKLVECPRDAMQGIKEFIPTDVKANYINQLLKVGFDTIDFGSFVSPKAIPQLRDTAEVLSNLDLSNTKSKLLSIIANKRGAEDAANFQEIDYLGFPYSISETFQQRNTNSSVAESYQRVLEIQEVCVKNNKNLVVYISMAFGNPYNDAYSPEIVAAHTEKLANDGIKIIALSDTIGSSNANIIDQLFNALIPQFPDVLIGAHLHTTPDTWFEKVDAAYKSGCRRFDGAIKGFGGCPMAKEELTGNMPTEKMLSYFEENNINTALNMLEFEKALQESLKVF